MMRRLLLAGRLDGRDQALETLEWLVNERRPDCILFAGGIVDGVAQGNGEPMSDAAREAPQAKLKTWEAFFDRFGRLGVMTMLVPGPADAPLHHFLRVAKQAEINFPSLRVAHATLWEDDHVAVCGMGGELTENEDRSDGKLRCARASAEYYLRTLWQSDQPRKALLLSVPPPGQLGGQSGNPICGELIDSYHPSLCVVAGETDERGAERNAHTLVVNPGRLADGSFAWLDWTHTRGTDVEVEFASV
jgi:Icc-related predicted phosphoesterase